MARKKTTGIEVSQPEANQVDYEESMKSFKSHENSGTFKTGFSKVDDATAAMDSIKPCLIETVSFGNIRLESSTARDVTIEIPLKHTTLGNGKLPYAPCRIDVDLKSEHTPEARALRDLMDGLVDSGTLEKPEAAGAIRWLLRQIAEASK